MGKVIDIIGKKFGKLTVLDIHSERGNRGQIRYECKCDCGNSHITSGESIRSGKSKSCGKPSFAWVLLRCAVSCDILLVFKIRYK